MGKFKRIDTSIEGVCIIEPTVFGDNRGYFMETYSKKDFEEIGLNYDFVQDNQSKSKKGVLRGLHFQKENTQAKLVRCIKGEVFDVAVDLRPGSKTYGKWEGVVLTEENKNLVVTLDEKADTEFIEAVKQSGLVGLGGAGFPAHIKLNPKDKIEYLCINAAECEPYITADVREIMENHENVLYGISQVMKYVGIDKALIGIEDNKPEAIKLMQEKTAQMSNVEVVSLPSRYPQGAEKVLIEQCTGRQVPPGKLPSDVGCIVMNVASAGFLGGYLKNGIPLTTKRVTVDGSAITEAKNVRVPIGAPIKDIIAFCGGYKGTPAKLISGGPMMGTALMTDDFPVLKQNNAFLAFDEAEAKSLEPTACISCGRCVNACPMNLMPTKLEAATIYKRVDDLKKYSVMTCMECGCCAFVCPANRKLVQSMRIGKAILRNAGK